MMPACQIFKELANYWGPEDKFYRRNLNWPSNYKNRSSAIVKTLDKKHI